MSFYVVRYRNFALVTIVTNKSPVHVPDLEDTSLSEDHVVGEIIIIIDGELALLVVHLYATGYIIPGTVCK